MTNEWDWIKEYSFIIIIWLLDDMYYIYIYIYKLIKGFMVLDIMVKGSVGLDSMPLH